MRCFSRYLQSSCKNNFFCLRHPPHTQIIDIWLCFSTHFKPMVFLQKHTPLQKHHLHLPGHHPIPHIYKHSELPLHHTRHPSSTPNSPPISWDLFVNQCHFSSQVYHPPTLSMVPFRSLCRDLSNEILPSHCHILNSCPCPTSKIHSAFNTDQTHTYAISLL